MTKKSDRSGYPPRPTQLAHLLLSMAIGPGDVVIDATAGNGHDTLFLASCVGEAGRVLAFDIQAPAIESTRRRVEAAGVAGRVRLFHESHVKMEAYAEAGSVAAILFNLGYLPGQDKSVLTKHASTLAALEASGRLLMPGGALSVICYPGHAEGAVEAGRVESWLEEKASAGWKLATYRLHGTLQPSPVLHLARTEV